MKQILSFYFIPIVILSLLTLANTQEFSGENLGMALLAAILLGSLAGFVFHIAILLRKKLSKNKKS